MPVLQFGAGLLYGVANAGNLPTQPTPIRLLLQEVMVDFKGDLKKLWVQEQLPIAAARGKVDVTGKAKIVDYSPDPITQLFLADPIAAGMTIFIDREQDPVPAAASFIITVANSATFDQDRGVIYSNGANAGQILINVGAGNAPGKGQYAPSSTAGSYVFNSQDNSTMMSISYTYTNATRGKTISMPNQLMGYAPICTVDVWNTFRGKVLGLRLNACVFGSWTFPSKLEDFWISDVAFDAVTDASDNLGKLFADSF